MGFLDQKINHVRLSSSTFPSSQKFKDLKFHKSQSVKFQNFKSGTNGFQYFQNNSELHALRNKN